MPVFKFRSIQDAKAARPRPSDDEALWRRIEGVLSWTALSTRLRPGVYRYRTVEDAALALAEAQRETRPRS